MKILTNKKYKKMIDEDIRNTEEIAKLKSKIEGLENAYKTSVKRQDFNYIYAWNLIYVIDKLIEKYDLDPNYVEKLVDSAKSASKENKVQSYV